MLELVDSLNLRLRDVSRRGSSPLSDIIYKLICNRGYSLIGKTAILHIVISGSRPDLSIFLVFVNNIILAREAQPGRAEL